MRRLAFLSVFFGCFVLLNNAWGDTSCQLTSCEAGGDQGKGWANLRTDGSRSQWFSSGQCYRCNWGDHQCKEGAVVAIKSHEIGFEQHIDHLFICQDGKGYDDDWVEFDPTQPCTTLPSDEPNAIYNPTKYDTSKMTWMIHIPGFSFKDGDSAVINNSSSSCKLYICLSGYAPSEDKRDCVKLNSNCKLSNKKSASTGHKVATATCNPSNPSTGLDSKAHVKSGNVCNVECVAGGWNVKLNDGACESGWVVDTSTYKKCIEDPAVAASRRDQQRRENASKQEKCQNSGGTWSSNKCICDLNKGLKAQGDECVCLDDRYERTPDGKSCKLTDVEAKKNACKSATGAYWDDDANRCRCEDEDSIWRGGKCVENTAKKRCKSASGTRWDKDAEECVCKDSNYEYDEDNNECIETSEARAKREAAEEAARKQAEQEASRGRITSITGKLNNLRSGLSQSVWKNKEGNFNTSRLVSDSVAGVVLGTAGGLITSNVIKKNQVKGGFEDIKCTVRGQVVAGYGDEFQVGIQ